MPIIKLLVWVSWAGALFWLLAALITLRALHGRKPLRAAALNKELMKDSAPLVSILVPARNEEGRVLPECIRSILEQDYGRFEVIAVNDRSTDATGPILHAIAKSDERLRVIDGAETPAGWLGKPFAMQQALDAARGRWVLATDADMIFDRAALRTAMTYVLERKVDALTFIPLFEAHSFWECVMMPVWSWIALVYMLVYRVDDPRSQSAIGIGGFFLMRRAALESVGGYRALRNEVLEDMRMADMLKRAGAALAFEYAPRLARTRMFRNFSEMWECNTKNWFSGMGFSVGRALSAVLSMYVCAVAPPLIALAFAIALTAGASAQLWMLFFPLFSIWVLQVFILATMSRRCRVPIIYSLATPLGLAVLYAMLFDSAVRISSGKGVMWKGRKVYERAGSVRPPSVGEQTPNISFADDRR
ncbi:MAG TPA: glycosyltransferase family 2 protein [Pyrinomonadaceae bacterium]|nr:glycosyltransferase family 2 protein [Pyrinomonadaceae bacterium]